MGRLRSIAGELRAQTKVRLRKGNALERAIYYNVFSDAFKRERLVVARGNQEYTRRRKLGQLEFLLRRNIHMAEKGLTMQPRRPTFAVAYIEETIELLGKLIEQKPAIISPEVENWAREVLNRYFEATETSDSDVIARARAAYSVLTWETEGDALSGPHVPFSGEPPVTIESMTALAVRRKSIRWFKPTPVPHEVVDKAMLVAAEAPSACNRQPFTFRIFDDPEMVQAVAAVPMGTAGYGHNLPSIAVIVGDLSAFIDERDRHLIYTDGCLAAMSFIFGLESQGVSSVCINWPDIAARDKKMSKLLGLSPHERVVMLVGFGYSDEAGLTPFSAKRALKDLRSYNEL
jgi:nitroreductase